MFTQKHLLITTIISFLVVGFALVAFAQLPTEEETARPEEMPPAEEPVIAPTPEELPTEEAPLPGPAAEEIVPAEVVEMVKADAEVAPEELEVGEPRILPDNPLYGVKNIWRGIKKAVTFNPVKKAELELQYANEKVIETEKMIEKNQQKLVEAEKIIEETKKNIEEAKASDKTDKEITQIVEEAEKQKEQAEEEIAKVGDKVETALDSYAKDIERIEKRTEKLAEKAKEDPAIEQFVDKFTDHQFKQQKLLDKIEKDVPGGEVFVKVAEVEGKSLEGLGKVIDRLVEPEKISEKITQAVEKQKGSDFKNFKNLEVLKELEDKVPEPAKEAIRLAQDNAIKRMQTDMEVMPEERRALFKDYVNNIPGNESRHMEIIHDFQSREIPAVIRETMEMAKETAIQRIDQRMKEFRFEDEKEMFFKHLEGGEMSDLRMIKELENNLPPQTIEQIVEIKNKAKLRFKEDFVKAPSPEKFFEEIERFHDVRQLEVLKELEEVIPEDKKDIFEQLKGQAMDEMEREIEMAKGIREKAMIMDKIAGDSPEHIQIIKEFGPPPEMLNEIMKEQIAKLSKKVETIEDAERLEFLKRRIEEEETVRSELESQHPEIFREIDEKEEMFFGQMTLEKASARVDEAKAEILLAENEYEALDEATQNEIVQMSPFQVLLNLAHKHVTGADEALANESYGEAFGQATAALHEANGARRIIKEISLRRQMHAPEMEEKFFEQQFEKRGQFEQKFERDFQGEEMFMPGQFREMMMPGLPAGMMPGMPAGEGREFDQAEFFKTKLPDAAVTYCQKLGYQTETRFDRGKKEYVCLLPDGLACYAWDFYNGQCGKMYRKDIKEVLKEELKTQMPAAEPGMMIPTMPSAAQCDCPFEWTPVCGSDGGTFPNKCIAECKGVSVVSEGPCQRGAMRPPEEEIGPPEQYYPEMPSRPEEMPSRPEMPEACIQVVTPAKDPVTGHCQEFPTPCDVPANWMRVDRCEQMMPPEGMTPPREEMYRPTKEEMYKPPEEEMMPPPEGGIFQIFKRVFGL